jgi:transcriptional regulator with XRE-family HTH domain
MGMTLKALRVNQGLTQREAADYIGVTMETLSRWERALTFPSVPQINKIEKLYKVKYSDIIFLPGLVGLVDKGGGENV